MKIVATTSLAGEYCTEIICNVTNVEVPSDPVRVGYNRLGESDKEESTYLLLNYSQDCNKTWHRIETGGDKAVCSVLDDDGSMLLKIDRRLPQ